MPIVRSMHARVISVQSWTYLEILRVDPSWGRPRQEKKKTDLILVKIVHLSTRTSSSPSFSRFQLCHTAPTQIIFSPFSPFNKAS